MLPTPRNTRRLRVLGRGPPRRELGVVGAALEDEVVDGLLEVGVEGEGERDALGFEGGFGGVARRRVGGIC